jgi:hypothetical protein
MALFDFTITDADMGRTLDPADGFLVNLVRTQPPLPGDMPQFSMAKQEWTAGRFFCAPRANIGI